MDKLQFDVFIQGQLIDLVALTEELVEGTNWYKWFNDEENTKYMQQHYFPNTKAMQLQFFKSEIEGSSSKLQLGIVEKKDQLFCGVISLHNIDYINRSCEISCIIGEAKGRNVKNFIEACQLIIQHAFDTLNMNRIYSGTIIKEIDQLFCRSLAFKHEGISRQQVYKNGKYHDVYNHSLLQEDYSSK